MPRILAIVLLTVAVIGGAAWGVWYYGEQQLAQGYRIGLLRGKAEAAKLGPVPIRDKGWTAGQLQGTPAWAALGDGVTDAEAEGLASLLNDAPSPCRKYARRGISVATSLLDPAAACPTAAEQARLGLIALRTFPDDAEEALAVLRVERRARPDVRGRPLRGNPDATVVVVEWGDFECPYCTRVQPMTAKLLEAAPEVGLAFKHFPLSFHPAAMPAAFAAEAAAEQGRFWEMHDALFDLGVEGVRREIEGFDPKSTEGPVPYETTAGEIGLDVERFRADFRSAEIEDRVRGDLAEGRAIGVGGTPTFFVENIRVDRPSVDGIRRLIARAEGERNWTFDWDLPEVPKAAAEDAPDEGAER